jgi:hypothetical protein
VLECIYFKSCSINHFCQIFTILATIAAVTKESHTSEIYVSENTIKIFFRNVSVTDNEEIFQNYRKGLLLWVNVKLRKLRFSQRMKILFFFDDMVLLLIIIVIFINCNWAVTRWQWLFYT